MKSSTLFAVATIAYLALYIANIVWGFRDARARGQSGALVALLIVFVPFPFGVIAWIIFRPEKASERTASARSSPKMSDDPDADLKDRANAGLL